MSTRPNPLAGRYFNNPAVANALSGLASAFAPPGAEEYLLAEKVRGERDQNDARSRLVGLAGDDFDRLGIAADLYDPTQSYYRVDQDNATNRYGIDTAATTSRTNNAADNLGLNQRAVLGAVTDPNGRQGVDAAMMSALFPDMGLPGFDAADPVMPSKTQVEGDALMEALGLMNPDQKFAYNMGNTPTTSIVGQGGQPQLTFGAVAARDGAQPFVNPGSQAAPEAITFDRNGQRMGGFVKNGQYVDAAGIALTPEEAGTAALVGRPVGTNDELGIGAGLKNKYYNTQAAASEVELIARDIESLLDTGTGTAGVTGDVLSAFQDAGQVLIEAATALSEGDPNGVIDEAGLRAMGDSMAGGTYNPVYRQMRASLFNLAVANAKLSDPGGELGAMEVARQLQNLGQGMLGNDASVRASLSIARQNARIAVASAEAYLGNPVAAPPPIAGTGGSPPIAAPGARQRAVNPATGEQVEWDGSQWVPVP